MAVGLTKNEFIAKAKLKHGELYDYSLVDYRGYLNPITIICKEHGTFQQKPNNHLFGSRCPLCSDISKSSKLLDSQDEFIAKAVAKYGDSYSYERVKYVSSKKKVTITCKKHGHFDVAPASFLMGHTICSVCSGSKITTELFIERARQTHGDRYDYSKSVISGMHNGITTIICKEHGEFEQNPGNHVQGKGCNKCAGRLVSDTKSFIDEAIIIHGGKYDYSLVDYVSSVSKVKILCPDHGSFEQTPGNHLQGNGCPKCVSKISKPEIELFEFVKLLCPDVIQSDRKIIAPFELDMVIPSKMIAIEFNGLHYHSDRNSGKKDTYHYDKMVLANKSGYRLIQVWEDDWKWRRGVVEKTLGYILGGNKDRYFARKCTVEIADGKSSICFLEQNHIQGCLRRGIVYTLKFENEMVAAMIFHPVSSERGKVIDKSKWELGRYATTGSVVGGASKLFSAFIKDHPECESVISYSDNDWFDGKMYGTLGFKFDKAVPPDYKVVDGGFRRHKINYKRSELEKRFGEKFNPLLTERENCRNNELYRVYNSGLKKWKWER